jgi:diguanylate cyclase (GGDEF)-like protein/PAS domain S-box-containing protein
MTNRESLAHDMLESGNEHFQIAVHPNRVLFWTTDPNGGCEVVSANWCDLTNQAPADAHGSGWLEIVAPEDRARVADAVRWAVSSHRGFYLHYRIRRPDGIIRCVLHDAAPRTLPSGKFNGLVGTLTDETDTIEGELALKNSAQQVYQFLGGVSLPTLAIDPNGELVHINTILADTLGRSVGDLIGSNWIDQYIVAEDQLRVRNLIGVTESAHELPQDIEFQVHTPSGRRLYRWHLILLRDFAGAPVSLTMMGTDITQWRRTGAQQRLAAQMFDNSKEAMVITDRNNLIVSVNRAFSALTGYSSQEAIGQNPRILQSGKHDESFYRDMWRSILEHGFWRGDIWDRRKDGTFYPKFLAISAIRENDEEISHFSAIFYDVSERKKLEERMETLAHYDALTGLPNRMLLQDRLEQAIAYAARLQQHFALLFIDLDGFKPVNDNYNHQVGDEVLKLVGQRIGAALRAIDTAARLGGDEFVVILTDIRDIDSTNSVAEKLVSALSEPYIVGEYTISISASIGASIYPNDEKTAQELLRSADEAMYQAKRTGKQRVIFYGGIGE